MDNSLTKEKIENILKTLENEKVANFVNIHKLVLKELCKLAIEKLEE